MLAEFVMKLAWSEYVWSDQLWIIIGGLFMLTGLIGCFVKKMPGTPLTWAGLLMLQLMVSPPFTTLFILLMAALTIIMIMADYVAPAISEKQFGSPKIGKYISNSLKFITGLYMAYEFVISVFIIG